MFLAVAGNGIPNVNQTVEKTEAKNLKRSRSKKLLKRAHLWRGKDYSNPIKKDFVDLHKPEQGTTLGRNRQIFSYCISFDGLEFTIYWDFLFCLISRYNRSW